MLKTDQKNYKWTKTMHRTAKLNDAMNKTKSDERSTTDLKETFPGSIKCDTKDLTIFQNGFEITACLQLQQTLRALTWDLWTKNILLHVMMLNPSVSLLKMD